ncbi:hypothetical protein F4780DRAFT_781684 [Xylariomycetidae sp. FL0641]|nr:hypothetical protein F4780DRAFT_781684 [Xylariomycetidae sp. FL0641]
MFLRLPHLPQAWLAFQGLRHSFAALRNLGAYERTLNKVIAEADAAEAGWIVVGSPLGGCGHFVLLTPKLLW